MKTVIKPILAALTILLIALLSIEGGLRVFHRSSNEERADFIHQAWRWPIDHYAAFAGPLMGAHVAHPFWGFHNNPHMPGVNALGFFDDDEFPYVKKENEVVVGLLGGSVAENAHQYLEEYIRANTARNLKPGCPVQIKVINLSAGATKQPSQFHIFSYFMETLDIAINVDGHNDAFFESGSHVPAAYPTFYREMFNMTPVKNALLSRSFIYGKIQYHLAKLVHEHPGVLKSELVLKIFEVAFEQLSRAKTKLALRVHGEPTTSIRFINGDAEDELVSIWKKYIILQDKLSKEFKKKSIFFIQPSQYATRGKILSDEEKEIAIIKDPAQRAKFASGFKKLRGASVDLAAKNIEIHDLSGMFSEEKETLFVDDCCHLNETGAKLLAKAVADQLWPYVNSRYCH